MSNSSCYSHRVPPYQHQADIFELTKDSEYYGLFWEMGTGKSKPIIDTICWLFQTGKIDGALIISDKGAYLNWGREEIPRHASIPLDDIFLVEWSSYWTRATQLSVEEIVKKTSGCLDIFLMNVESFSSTRAVGYADRFLRSHRTMMVVDESTSIKSPGAQRTKNIMKLGARSLYRRILTGTPVANGPLDVFSQCNFLKRGVLGMTSFVSFRAVYADIRTIQMGTRSFPKVFGYRNLEQLHLLMRPFTSRILKVDCLDLPDKVYETRYVEHTPEQANAYQKLKAEALLMFREGEVTITSALTLMMKLHQINCGHVNLDDGTTMDVPSNRVAALMDILEQAPRKVLIWGRFTRDIELVIEGVGEKYGPSSMVRYDGQVDDRSRARALERFHQDDECKYFIGNPTTGGKGLTLVEADTTIYYSNDYRLETRLQSEDRNHRIGQVNRVTYFDLIVPNTVDIKVVRALREKKDLAKLLLDDLRALLE